MVRQALAGAVPPEHQYPARAKPKLDALLGFVDAVVAADRLAPRKQRHIALRFYAVF